MKSQNFLLLLCVALIGYIAITSFKPQNKTYEHLIIMTEGSGFGKVFISIDGREHKILSFEKQIKGGWDFGPVINLVHSYENDGWELIETEIVGGNCSFRMRR